MDCPKCGVANLDQATQCVQCEAQLPKPARHRGWLFQHPLLVTISGAVIAGLFSLTVAVINNSGDDVTLIPVDRMPVAAFDPTPRDPKTPNGNVSNALPNVPKMPDRSPEGSQEGLHGPATCEVNKLVAYLMDATHTRQAEAWAKAAGIKRADIPAYFKGLTPVRLRFDTRVTNYDYKDGHADGYQAVLQAGTSVLVDNRGVPRAKCNCGNPLMEPTGPRSTEEDVDDFAKNPDDAWDGFDPRQAVTVRSGRQVDQLVLLDIDDGQAYRRTIGGDGTGDVPVGQGDPACAALTVSTSCGGPGPQTTAEDVAQLEKTLRRLVKAIQDGDCNALIDSMSAAAVAQFDLHSGESVAACQQAFQVLKDFGGITVNDIKVISQTGARAVVSTTITVNGESITAEDHFIRENGNWKVDIGQT